MLHRHRYEPQGRSASQVELYFLYLSYLILTPLEISLCDRTELSLPANLFSDQNRTWCLWDVRWKTPHDPTRLTAHGGDHCNRLGRGSGGSGSALFELAKWSSCQNWPKVYISHKALPFYLLLTEQARTSAMPGKTGLFTLQIMVSGLEVVRSTF